MLHDILNYIPLAITILIIVAYGAYLIYKQPEKIKEWLKYACIQAEISLGSGTGKLKLRQVYDIFIGKYPIISKFISFEKFSQWVDEILPEINQWIEENINIEALINGEKNEK